ncbi:FtsX-like permease family protein [Flammeovirgaceae bacterium SG7u.111]|nr:FtsX-like permease family protein [Flammeovirgaceae bacterium SG7u.132]WPO38208.1 FtsX-like permease family protein [Flammeovirgaceae bacterium SG7u.111]
MTEQKHYRMNTHLYTSHLKIIFRHLYRNKPFTFINLFGLAIGLSVTLFVALFIYNEMNYEQMHSKADRIFRLSMHLHSGNYDTQWARVNADWVNNLQAEIPEVERLVRFQDYQPRNVKVGEHTFKVENAYTTDADVFEVFDFNLFEGDTSSALSNPYSVVLTASMAQKFFGKTDVVGQEIEILDDTKLENTVYLVTGVMDDLPSNTHLPVNMLASFASGEERKGWAYTYLLLHDQNPSSVEGKMPSFILKHAGEEDAQTIDLFLQNIKTIHLHSDLAREIMPNGKMSYLYLFGSVGLFVLLMSCINFINLNTAQSLKRMREIGVRKVLGSSKFDLVAYFFFESFIIASVATVLGLLLVTETLPFFRDFSPIAIPITTLLPFALTVILFIAFVASYYPAFILTRQRAVSAMKSKNGFTPYTGKFNTKNILVSAQLVLCITLISGALITRSQFHYLMDKNLGLEKEQVLALTDIPDPVKYKFDLLKQQLNQLPEVKAVAGAMQVPSSEIRDVGSVYAEGMTADLENPPVMDIQVIDKEFIDLMGVELVAGRAFLENKTADVSQADRDNLLDYLQAQPREYLINETAARLVGWNSPEEALGKEFSWSIGGVNLQRGQIIGVVKDFHQESLRNGIEPLVMVHEPVWVRNVLVKIDGGHVQEAMGKIATLWKANFPNYPLKYSFLDELYDRLYENEKKQLQLMYLFTGLAIFISFIGIFGLISYMLKTREKEIAVRKVLGANLSSITVLLTKNFLFPAVVGVFFAVPLTWSVMEKWLQGFAYRIEISGLSFMIAIAFIFSILMVAVLGQLSKLAKTNIAKTLRSE